MTPTSAHISDLQLRIRIAVQGLAQALVDSGVGDGADLALGLWRGGLALATRVLLRGDRAEPAELLTGLPDGGDVLEGALSSWPSPLSAFVAEVRGESPGAVPASVLGRVYEGLIDLQPGISTEPMVRMRRGRLEAVVPAAAAPADDEGSVRWVEDLAAGQFFTFRGLGRKQSGAYYTPRALVRFIVAGALEPLVERTRDLRVLDPATGSGHFLVEAVLQLGDSRGSRRRIAERALYGVDRDGLALEITREALWELCGEGPPPPEFMVGKLVRGDSLSGPTPAQMGTRPSTGEPLGASGRLQEAIRGATPDPAWATVAQAFSGGLALSSPDDAGYEALVEAVAQRAPVAPVLQRHPEVAAMIEAGQEAISFEIAFPEVFGSRRGFDAVVGNPPWEALRPRAREFYAGLDLRVLDAPTRRERRDVEEEREGQGEVAAQRQDYAEAFARQRRVHRRLFRWQTARVGRRNTGGDPDLWKLFMERCASLVREGGEVGLLVPSAFHTNASAAGVRRLFLDRMALRGCYSFDNRRGLFDIHRSFKFDLVLARRDAAGTREFPCAFHLQDPAWLQGVQPTLTYTSAFLARVGGEHRVFPELRSSADQGVAEACYAGTSSFGQYTDRHGIRLTSALHMTHDAGRFTPAREVLDGDAREPSRARGLRERGYWVLHEGKTFHQFDDRWGAPTRYLVRGAAVEDRPDWIRAAGFYRLTYRAVASSTNERTCIFCLLPPGVLCGNSAPVEAEPWTRPTCAALFLVALANTHVVDFLVRIRSSANLNQFILRHTALPRPGHPSLRTLAVHTALRLSCNHAGYADLRAEQLGDAWREPTPPETWPMVGESALRARLRGVLDAVAADAFGLSRPQLEHVLTTFSHRSSPAVPELVLEAFDDLRREGREAFAARCDPYRDVPLVASPPSPSSSS